MNKKYHQHKKYCTPLFHILVSNVSEISSLIPHIDFWHDERPAVTSCNISMDIIQVFQYIYPSMATFIMNKLDISLYTTLRGSGRAIKGIRSGRYLTDARNWAETLHYIFCIQSIHGGDMYTYIGHRLIRMNNVDAISAAPW